MSSEPPGPPSHDTHEAPNRRRPTAVRVLAALAVLTVCGTYLAAQIDYLRRHEPGITPSRYLLPQALQIWLPGIAAAAGLAAAAWVLGRRGRRRGDASEKPDQSPPTH